MRSECLVPTLAVCITRHCMPAWVRRDIIRVPRHVLQKLRVADLGLHMRAATAVLSCSRFIEGPSRSCIDRSHVQTKVS
jgi:hypothetical protein